MENKQQPELVVLPAEHLQAALNYLATRPYNEAAKLIENILKTTAKVDPKQQEESTSEKA